MKKKLIIVLGMHRSGTSVISRALKVIGVDLGNNLLPGGTEENAKGFWEDIDILNLNDEMLVSLSSTWHDFFPITADATDKLKEMGFLTRARNLLENKIEHSRVFGFKDPRFAKLLYFWKQVFAELNINVNYIVALRHPLSVSQSLYKRNGFPPTKSLFLWFDHIITCLDQTQNEKRILVDYDLLMENPEKAIYHMAKTFELPVNLEQLQEFINEFLDSKLRHTTFTEKDLVDNLSIPNVISETYLELSRTHLSEHILNSSTFYNKLENWKKYIDSQKYSWGLINEINSQHGQVLAEKDSQLADRDTQIIQRDQQIIVLRELANELASIKNTRSWIIYFQLVKILRRVFPQDSVQIRIFNFLWKILRTIYRNGIFPSIRVAANRAIEYIRRNLLWANLNSTGTYIPIMPAITKQQPRDRADSIDIIVCIHNALDDVKRCLESIEKNSQHPYQLLLVDDGSAEPTKNYLQEFSQQKKHCKLIRNDQAGGYTRAANKGLRASTAEFIVLLNSDTIVGPEWLDRLYTAITSDEKIGVAGPLSNTASWQSIPNLEEYGDWATNSLPQGISTEQMSLLIAKYSSQVRPEVKLLNGFCMMIKKALIDEIGFFDEESFGEGYGEEDDFNLRARQAGWKLVLADDVYIFHAQSKSYSNERRHRLSQRAGKILREKHSNQTVTESVDYMHPNRIMEGIRARSKVLQARDEHLQKGQQEFLGKKILFILPVSSAGGGANVVIDEARCMQQMGVDVRIFNLEEYKDGFLKSYPHLDIPVTFGQKDDLMYCSRSYDAIIATANYSVEWLKSLKEKNEDIILGYYIQGFEVLMYQKSSSDYRRAMESYTLIDNMRLFSKTEWVKNTIFQNTGAKVSKVGISVNTDLFCPRHVRKFGIKPVVITAMIRPGSSYRNPALTMNVLRQVEKELGQNVQIRLFGSDDIRDPSLGVRWDFNWIQAGKLTQHQVANFLSDADIFVDFSSHQAMGLTALEAMACGCAVIVPSYGGAVEFVRHGETGMIVDTSNPQVCFNVLKSLVQNDSLRTNIQIEAMKHIVQYYPEKVACEILKVMFTSPKSS